MDDIKIVKLLEDSGLLIEGATETVRHEIKKQDNDTYGFIIDSTHAFFIDITCCLFIYKCHIWKRSHKCRKREWSWKDQEEDIITCIIWIKFFIPASSFKQYWVINYVNYQPRFNDVFSRGNLLRIKDGVYVINLDDKEIKGTYLVSLFVDKNTCVYFDFLELNIFHKKYKA